MSKTLRLAGAALAVLLMSGCAKTYMVTQPLAQPLTRPVTFVVGEIADELPTDVPAAKKPSPEDLQKFRRFVEQELTNRGIGRSTQEVGGEATCEVQGSLLEYKRGSGAARFFIGFGAGSAHATVAMKLVDRKSGTVLFAGNFRGNVSSWTQGGDQIFRAVARNFALELDKRR